MASRLECAQTPGNDDPLEQLLAVDAVFELSRGNLRAIDHLARKSLEFAAVESSAAVDPSLVAAVRLRQDLQVASAGICLDGTDQAHNLSSIVGVMDEAVRGGMDDEDW